MVVERNFFWFAEEGEPHTQSELVQRCCPTMLPSWELGFEGWVSRVGLKGLEGWVCRECLKGGFEW